MKSGVKVKLEKMEKAKVKRAVAKEKAKRAQKYSFTKMMNLLYILLEGIHLKFNCENHPVQYFFGGLIGDIDNLLNRYLAEKQILLFMLCESPTHMFQPMVEVGGVC